MKLLTALNLSLNNLMAKKGKTLLLTIPMNSIIYALSGVAIKATVSVPQATILVLISLLLTMIAGLISAKMANNCFLCKYMV